MNSRLRIKPISLIIILLRVFNRKLNTNFAVINLLLFDCIYVDRWTIKDGCKLSIIIIQFVVPDLTTFLDLLVIIRVHQADNMWAFSLPRVWDLSKTMIEVLMIVHQDGVQFNNASRVDWTDISLWNLNISYKFNSNFDAIFDNLLLR